MLPNCFEELTSLTYLNLDDNDFNHVPETLGRMTQLTCISMCHNPIRELSDDLLLALAKLDKFDLRDTNIKERPAHWKVK